jgi:hypothetical protein
MVHEFSQVRVPFDIISKFSPDLKASLNDSAFALGEALEGSEITIELFLRKARLRDAAVFEKYFGQEDGFKGWINEASASAQPELRGEVSLRVHPTLSRILLSAYRISTARRDDQIELSHIAVALALDDDAAKQLCESSKIYVRGERESRRFVNTVWECLLISRGPRERHDRTFHLQSPVNHHYKLSVRNGNVLGDHRASELRLTVNGACVLSVRGTEANAPLLDCEVSLRSDNDLTAEIAGGEWASVHIRIWH